MKALTLWPEWAWAICALEKRVENRGWHPWSKLAKNERIAIHAGKHLGGRPGVTATDEAVDAVFWMNQRHRSANGMPDYWPERELLACPRSAFVCVATVTSFDRNQLTGWDVPGCWHWRLSDVRVLPQPIPCKGALGLWEPNEEIQRQLAEVLRG